MSTKTTVELAVGDAAPAFDHLDGAGKKHTLSDYKGKTVVLYFYPKDITPGCTIEACDFRDLQPKFQKKGAVVLGVSPDPAKLHQKFTDKFELNFPLLVDEEKTLCNAYGVWQLKKFMGREFMGVVRSTFVIDPNGKLSYVEYGVSAKGHAEAMLGEL
ncbi:MAG: thioredoxin-dependent thiol peroxidase [Elusimicrobia bacterium]|nr:MAG: thioredoxin-dependent thiol peroxidase [Elusimicrobiota bacterium]